MVDPVHHYSNNSLLLPPGAAELSKLAAAAARAPSPATSQPTPPQRLSRRLGPETCAEIAEKYRAGATTPALCVEYGLSKGGLLRLLSDRGVEMRRQPLTADQVEQAVTLYGYGFSIASIANYLDTSFNNVRQNFERLGIERRPRGGSRPTFNRARTHTLDEQQGMTAVLLYIAGGPLEAVASAVGAGTGSVRQYLVDTGVPIRRRGRPPRREPSPDSEGVVISTASYVTTGIA